MTAVRPTNNPNSGRFVGATGADATGAVTFTLGDSAGHTIPAGTALVLGGTGPSYSDGIPAVTTEEKVVANGQTSGAAVPIEVGQVGKAANSLTTNSHVKVVAAHPVAAVNEVQVVTVANATDGTFTLTFDTDETTALDHDAATTVVQAALVALDGIETGDVAVTGTPGAYTVTFGGTLAGTNVPELVGDATNLVGEGKAVTVTTSTPGHAAYDWITSAALDAAPTGGVDGAEQAGWTGVRKLFYDDSQYACPGGVDEYARINYVPGPPG